MGIFKVINDIAEIWVLTREILTSVKKIEQDIIILKMRILAIEVRHEENDHPPGNVEDDREGGQGRAQGR